MIGTNLPISSSTSQRRLLYPRRVALLCLLLLLRYDNCSSQQQQSGGRVIGRKQRKNKDPTQQRSGGALSDAESTEPVARSKSMEAEAISKSSCPACSSTTMHLKTALYSFWNNDLYDSYACICEALSNPKASGGQSLALAESTLYAIFQSKHIIFEGNVLFRESFPKQEPRTVLLDWEVLGPLPVGKLELDGDPTFMYHDEVIAGEGGVYRNKDGESICQNSRPRVKVVQRGFDPILYVLSMHHICSSVISEMATKGELKWKDFRARDDGLVPTSYSPVLYYYTLCCDVMCCTLLCCVALHCAHNS